MKKVLCLVLCCLIVTGLFGTAAFASGEAKPVDYSEHEEFTVWLYATPNDHYADYSENPVVQYLNEKFNVTLKYEQPASGTEQDSLSLMFGTGEYTDMIEVAMYTGSIRQLYADGVIVNIADYLDYMPNLKAALEKYPEFRRYAYADEGVILKIPNYRAIPEQIWGGMVYRRDILDTMTGGNVAFPSGNAEPTTVADWDYMLPLFKAYFDAAGMAHAAPLIIPYNGYFGFGEVGVGFDFAGLRFYVEDDTVKCGLLDAGLYDYLEKMNEWYEKGYIYQDFASRVNDPFYLPNTELTYGGAAGMWYGFANQLGSAMSMPEYGLEVDVHVAANPLNEGVDASTLLNRRAPIFETQGTGSVVTTKCKNIPKLLSIFDFLYSDEGSMIATVGLTKEQLPKNHAIYEANGLMDGVYWYEGDRMVINPLMSLVGGKLELPYMAGHRMPHFDRSDIITEYSDEYSKIADAAWGAHDGGSKAVLPTVLSYTLEDERYIKDFTVALSDYVNAMIPKFIMGSEKLTPESYQAFVDQVNALGMEKCLALQQEAYNSFMSR